MSIDYKLHEYNLPSGADYRARVQHQRTLDLDDVINHMAARNSGISKAIMIVVFGEFLKTLITLLVDGYKIETPFAVFSITIKGDFTSPDDKFDHQRHKIELNIAVGDPLKDGFAGQLRPRKRQMVLPHPIISRCTSGSAPTASNVLWPGRIATIHGTGLKFDENDPSQGIFLTPVQSSADPQPMGSPLRIDDVGHNKGRKLVFVVPPDLPPGLYQLEVRARFGRHTVRTGQYSQVLIVQ